MLKCKKCCLPEGALYVTLNENMICNYCTYYDEKYKSRFENYDKLKISLKKRFDKQKDRFQYDALVGISGGKDGLYVLFKLIKDYNLNVLAFTVDNGFLTDYARENIKVAVKTLGVEHFFYSPNWNLHKKLYQGALKIMGSPCDACAYMLTLLGIKLCYEKKIPFFVHGRSPYQIFRNFFEGSEDSYIPIMELNAKEHSFEKIRRCYIEITDKFKRWVRQIINDDRLSEDIYREFFPDSSDLESDFAPEFLAFFLFEPYNEEKIKNLLEKDIGYKRASNDALLSHGDCKIHDASAYLYQQIRGIPFSFPEIAAMFRIGDMDNKNAEELFSREEFTDESLQTSIHALCNTTDMNEDDLNKLIPEIRNQSKFPGFMW